MEEYGEERDDQAVASVHDAEAAMDTSSTESGDEAAMYYYHPEEPSATTGAVMDTSSTESGDEAAMYYYHPEEPSATTGAPPSGAHTEVGPEQPSVPVQPIAETSKSAVAALAVAAGVAAAPASPAATAEARAKPSSLLVAQPTQRKGVNIVDGFLTVAIGKLLKDSRIENPGEPIQQTQPLERSAAVKPAYKEQTDIRSRGKRPADDGALATNTREAGGSKLALPIPAAFSATLQTDRGGPHTVNVASTHTHPRVQGNYGPGGLLSKSLDYSAPLMLPHVHNQTPQRTQEVTAPSTVTHIHDPPRAPQRHFRQFSQSDDYAVLQPQTHHGVLTTADRSELGEVRRKLSNSQSAGESMGKSWLEKGDGDGAVDLRTGGVRQRVNMLVPAAPIVSATRQTDGPMPLTVNVASKTVPTALSTTWQTDRHGSHTAQSQGERPADYGALATNTREAGRSKLTLPIPTALSASSQTGSHTVNVASTHTHSRVQGNYGPGGLLSKSLDYSAPLNPLDARVIHNQTPPRNQEVIARLLPPLPPMVPADSTVSGPQHTDRRGQWFPDSAPAEASQTAPPALRQANSGSLHSLTQPQNATEFVSQWKYPKVKQFKQGTVSNDEFVEIFMRQLDDCRAVQQSSNHPRRALSTGDLINSTIWNALKDKPRSTTTSQLGANVNWSHEPQRLQPVTTAEPARTSTTAITAASTSASTTTKRPTQHKHWKKEAIQKADKQKGDTS